MENIYAVLLAFLEMTFIFVSLALFHSQRKTIGSSVFLYICRFAFPVYPVCKCCGY